MLKLTKITNKILKLVIHVNATLIEIYDIIFIFTLNIIIFTNLKIF